MNRKFLFILGSARSSSNTALLAQKAAENLPKGTEQRWLSLAELPLSAFEDIRHDVGVYPQPEGNEKILFEATLWATDIVIASPLYWYNLSSSTKFYLDYWSAWMRVPDAQFKPLMAGKKMWGISVSSSETHEEAEAMSAPLIKSLQLSADYMHMDWGGVLLGLGNRGGDVLLDEVGMGLARGFFGID